MTVSNHSALYRFTFPNGGTNISTAPPVPNLPYSPLILADLTDLSDSRTNASIQVDSNSGRITATGTFGPSFGVGTYDLHFCADFKGARIRDTGVFMNNRAGSDPKSLKVYPDGTDSPPVPAGAWVQFQEPDQNDQILVRVGLSFMSTDQACSNAEKEIAAWDFESLRTSAEEVWRQKLGVVQVDATGVNASLQTTFWSGVYRSMISPQDYTGENPLWQSDEPCKLPEPIPTRDNY
jgi:putative alpha-1,2-mannosidase